MGGYVGLLLPLSTEKYLKVSCFSSFVLLSLSLLLLENGRTREDKPCYIYNIYVYISQGTKFLGNCLKW